MPKITDQPQVGAMPDEVWNRIKPEIFAKIAEGEADSATQRFVDSLNLTPAEPLLKTADEITDVVIRFANVTAYQGNLLFTVDMTAWKILAMRIDNTLWLAEFIPEEDDFISVILQPRPGVTESAAPNPERNSLHLLRETAQELLVLTDGCLTLPHAAQEIYLRVNQVSTSPVRHEAMRTSLEILAVRMQQSMAELIELYVNGCAMEERLDEEGNHGNR